jgi:hypothetical protein
MADITLRTGLGRNLTAAEVDANFTALNEELAAVATPTLTIQDESSPLATAATTLNFTGSGVTASGSGATKTINILAGGDALVANPLSQFAATTSLQLKNTISDETGSGALVFATSPTLVTPALGTPASGNLANCTGYPGAGGSVSLITETVTSGSQASVTFSAIAATYRDLLVVVRGRHNTAATTVDIFLRFNADSGANYHNQQHHSYGTGIVAAQQVTQTQAKIGNLPGNSATANYAGTIQLRIGDYRGTTFYKSVVAQWANSYGSGGFTQGVGVNAGLWASTSAITSVEVRGDADYFVDGTVISLYGQM